ncbi:hypothetical protein HK096_005379 [Nowakowskiella sp. JEL0078]|nr:hypothetical protein HK096_005379 [Nowakowskiella sp. JEL0078]
MSRSNASTPSLTSEIDFSPTTSTSSSKLQFSFFTSSGLFNIFRHSRSSLRSDNSVEDLKARPKSHDSTSSLSSSKKSPNIRSRTSSQPPLPSESSIRPSSINTTLGVSQIQHSPLSIYSQTTNFGIEHLNLSTPAIQAKKKSVFNFESASDSPVSSEAPNLPTKITNNRFAPRPSRRNYGSRCHSREKLSQTSYGSFPDAHYSSSKGNLTHLNAHSKRRGSANSVTSSNAFEGFGEPLRKIKTHDPKLNALKNSRSHSRSRSRKPRSRGSIIGIGQPVLGNSPPNARRRSFFWIDGDDDDLIDVEDEDEESEREESVEDFDGELTRDLGELNLDIDIQFEMSDPEDEISSNSPTSARITKGVEFNKVKILLNPSWTISQKLQQKALISKIFQYDDPRSELTLPYHLHPCESNFGQKFSESEDRKILILLQEIGIGDSEVYSQIKNIMNSRSQIRSKNRRTGKLSKERHGSASESHCSSKSREPKLFTEEQIKERCEYLVKLVLKEDN